MFAKPLGEKIGVTEFFREWQQAPLVGILKEFPQIEVTDLQKQLDAFQCECYLHQCTGLILFITTGSLGHCSWT